MAMQPKQQGESDGYVICQSRSATVITDEKSRS